MHDRRRTIFALALGGALLTPAAHALTVCGGRGGYGADALDRACSGAAPSSGVWCCDATANGSQCAPAPGNVCPNPGPTGELLAFVATGGAPTVRVSTTAPFVGMCIAPRTSQDSMAVEMPKSCAAIALHGASVQSPAWAVLGPQAVGANDFASFEEDCFAAPPTGTYCCEPDPDAGLDGGTCNVSGNTYKTCDPRWLQPNDAGVTDCSPFRCLQPPAASGGAGVCLADPGTGWCCEDRPMFWPMVWKDTPTHRFAFLTLSRSSEFIP
jgi:hypothetical protein